VTITCSENFYNFSGAPFISGGGPNLRPPRVFNAWKWNATDTLLVEAMLMGIDRFESQNVDWCLFKMLNGMNLTNNNLVNIIPNAYLADMYGNIPNENNQKIPVRVKGDIGDINIGPNPFNINIDYWNDNQNGNLIHIIPIDILDGPDGWINNNGGTIVKIIIIGDEIMAEKGIAVNMIVFDAVGNLVTKRYNPDILDKSQLDPGDPYLADKIAEIDRIITALKNNELVELHFYYEGMNDRGMKCAPGVYRLVFYLIYEDKDGPKKRKTSAILAITNAPKK
jgi:hypothetical protein